MPIVRVDMWEGRSIEQKRRVAEQITRVLADETKCDPATVRVLFTDYQRENWAVGGQLQSDLEAAGS